MKAKRLTHTPSLSRWPTPAQVRVMDMVRRLVRWVGLGGCFSLSRWPMPALVVVSGTAQCSAPCSDIAPEKGQPGMEGVTTSSQTPLPSGELAALAFPD